MKLIAIETSCDETAVTILQFEKGDFRFKVLTNNLISQIDLHKEYGGVFPNLAKREHIKNLPILIQKSLRDCKLTMNDIDAVAVTSGPGLAPALWVGVEEAKKIAIENKIPLYPINHMEGHIFASLVEEKSKGEYLINTPSYPSLALLISGGHTELVFMPTANKYEVVGETLDDAVGEAFDKAARSLDLEYPGGPKISKLAEKARQKRLITTEEWRLPRPMISSKDLNFSFSGLKTAVMYRVQKLGIKNEVEKEMISMEFENSVTDVINKKVETAIFLYNAKSLIVGGGVSANNNIRENLEHICKSENIELFLPDRSMSTDNALMIGIIAINKINNNESPVNPSDVVARSDWSIDEK